MSTTNEQSRDAASVRLPPPLIYLGAVGAGIALQRWLIPLSLPLDGTPRVSLGILIIATALTLIVVSSAAFRKTGQKLAPWTSTPSIVKSGVYRYTRNPMYSGLGLGQLGLSVALGNLWVAVMLIPALGLVYLTAIRHEEAYLERKFGAEYRAYKSSVRRWL